MRKFIVRRVNVSQLIDLLIEAEHDNVKYINLKCTLGEEEDTVEFEQVDRQQRVITSDVVDENGLITDEALTELFKN